MAAGEIAAIGRADAGGDSSGAADDEGGCNGNGGKADKQNDAGKADNETGNALTRQTLNTP
ncbi:hypothetical protein D3C86_2219810 [compost metagenome]